MLSSSFKASAGMLSGPAAFPICSLISLLSLLIGLVVFIRRLVPVYGVSGEFAYTGQFIRFSKFSAYRFSCPSVLGMGFLSLTGRSGLLSCHIISLLYSFLVFPFLAACHATSASSSTYSVDCLTLAPSSPHCLLLYSFPALLLCMFAHDSCCLLVPSWFSFIVLFKVPADLRSFLLPPSIKSFRPTC